MPFGFLSEGLGFFGCVYAVQPHFDLPILWTQAGERVAVCDFDNAAGNSICLHV